MFVGTLASLPQITDRPRVNSSFPARDGLPNLITGLLVKITRCQVAARCLQGEQLPCSAIVGSQQAASADRFHVPEPWSGHMPTAPILFVSSNPSIDLTEAYPTAAWDDGKRIDFFDRRFDPRTMPWIDDRMRPLLDTSPPRHRAKGTRFWFAAKRRASEMLEREAQAGRDFALTEVVHCKSTSEHGVADAYGTCVQTWLRPVMQASGASVVVLFGVYAKDAFHTTYGIPPGVPMTGPHDLDGVPRIVLQLPHPNARQPRANCAPLTPQQLATVRRHLRQPHAGRARPAR